VVRCYGISGIQERIRLHISLAKDLAEKISQENDFELLAPVKLNTVCFRYFPAGKNETEINLLNETLNHQLNDSGKIYLTHTQLRNKYTLRMVTAQTNVTRDHTDKAWDLIRNTARNIQK